MCFLGGGLGNVVGSFFGGRYLDYELAKRAKINGAAIPEDRFPISVFASGFVIQPLGCLLFTWGVANKWPLAVPIAGIYYHCYLFIVLFNIYLLLF